MAVAKRLTLGSGDPKRLFVGGLHGDEWMHTSELLESLDAPTTGTLVIIPKLTDRAYVSTLDARYYEGYGRDLVAAIEEIKPAIYLELHSYRDFYGLTDSRRIDKKGVPAYVELEDRVLVGSISPILRRRCFSVRDFCVSFEIPAEGGKSRKLAKELLDFTKDCVSAARFVDFMLSQYPEQGMRAIETYKRFYRI
ncbi:MAG TPA: DUF2119 domain-containing protein [Methanosarcinales archaeon]|nr:MAG: DUF2119 domain-containing protein [Methanosarcinales archaeon]HDN65374.1 DUF2119 domain-containing protein [Methanosarcinales archaeon]